MAIMNHLHQLIFRQQAAQACSHIIISHECYAGADLGILKGGAHSAQAGLNPFMSGICTAEGST